MKQTILKLLVLVFSLKALIACNQPDNRHIQTSESSNMKQVLIIGMDLKTVDFSKPAFESGLTAEKVGETIKTEIQRINDAGYTVDVLSLYPDSINMDVISSKLKSSQWDGVLIGYGIRMSPSNFSLFEKLVNQIHKDLPDAYIILNNDSKASDMLESIQRWL